MRMRGSLAKGLLIALAVALIPVTAVSAQKITPGSTCKVLNQKIVYQNKTYTCIKSGKKLVWNKGVFVTPKDKPTITTPTFTPIEVFPRTVKIESDLEITYLSPINWGGLPADSAAVMKFPVTLKSSVDANLIRVLVQHSEGVQHILISGVNDWQYVKAGESKTLDTFIPLDYFERERLKGYTGGYTFRVTLSYKDSSKREVRLEIPIDFVLPTQK